VPLYKSIESIQLNRQTAGVREVYILLKDIPIYCKFHEGSVLCATCIRYFFLCSKKWQFGLPFFIGISFQFYPKNEFCGRII